MTITLRQESAIGATTKLDTLTYKELDDNFIHLLNNKIRPLQVNADTGVVTVGEAQSNGVFTITGEADKVETTVTETSAGDANLSIALVNPLPTNIDGALSFTAKNTSGVTIEKGEPVYITGHDGNTTTIAKADADDATKMPAFGLANEQITNTNSGQIIIYGPITNLDTSHFAVGEELFVATDPNDSAGGSLTATPPTSENSLLQKVGKVVKAHASTGIIVVTGAGRTNATPNLNDGNIFIGNGSNQITTSNLQTLVESYSINNVVEDTTPQLGGTLDAQSNNITNLGTINGHTIPGGTGTIALTSDIPADTNTTYSISAETTTGGANLRLTDSSAVIDDVKIAQGTNITVTRTDANTITIASTVTSGISNVVEDTTPQLGGALDVNGNAIVSSSNQDINLNPDGTGKVNINNTYTLPNTDGTNGQVLTTNGTGTLSFTTVSSGGGATVLNDLTDVTITSPADNQFLRYDSGTSKFINETVTLNENFNDLNDVSVGGATDGQSIQYNSGSGQWEPYTPGAGGGATALNDLTDVSASGPTDGQVIQYNSGASQWQTVTLSFLSNISEDTTPQLGGTLDCQDNIIQSPDLKDYKETVHSLGTTDNPSISISNGNVQSVTITSGLNLPAFNDAATGQSVTLIVSGSGSATGTGAYIFAGGNKTLTTKSIVSIFYDGTNYWTSISTDFQA